MKARDFQKMNEKELQDLLRERREELMKKRFDLSAGRLKNVREIRAIKKDIARILTIVNQRRKNA